MIHKDLVNRLLAEICWFLKTFSPDSAGRMISYCLGTIVSHFLVNVLKAFVCKCHLPDFAAKMFLREELAKLREDNTYLANRLGLDPTPASQLRAPSVSSQGSNTHTAHTQASQHAAPGPAIANWLQSLIPPAAGLDGASEHVPSRAPSVRSDAGSHTSGKGQQGASPPVQPNWLQALVPQSGTSDQPLALPWGKLF